MVNKYRNNHIKNDYGDFDSKLEYNRFLVLLDAQARGEIRNLKRQQEYLLIPAQRRPRFIFGKRKVKEVMHVVERACYYLCDFSYEKYTELYGFRDEAKKDFGPVGRGWVKVVEDVKGSQKMVTADAKIKKKLMLHIYGIEVRYVTKATEEI